MKFSDFAAIVVSFLFAAFLVVSTISKDTTKDVPESVGYFVCEDAYPSGCKEEAIIAWVEWVDSKSEEKLHIFNMEYYDDNDRIGMFVYWSTKE